MKTVKKDMANMKIVLLDVDTVTNGDVSLAPIERLGEAVGFPLLPPEEVAAAIGDADAVVCNKTEITAEVMAACENLKFIGVFATGYNNIDLAAAKARGIAVCNVPGYSTDAVAQHVFAMVLSLVGSLAAYDRSVHAGDWVREKRFTYFPYPLHELAGKTLGIFGCGAIGKKVAAIGRAFGMDILVSTRTPAHCPDETCCLPDELFAAADVLTFHCPLTPETQGIINRRTLSLMKPTALLINTARGGIMDEVAVADALHAGVIAGAGIDVQIKEPMAADNPLLLAPHCILTPHIAWAPFETRVRLIDRVAENLSAFQNGSPINTVI